MFAVQLTLISNLGSSERANDLIILDPRFPERLTMSGYKNIRKFVLALVKEYAQAGLSNESDREIAISGLLKRMDGALKSKHRYGVFMCFLSRFLLWRVDLAGSTENASMEDHGLPSWSWMTHNQIEFFPAKDIKIRPRYISFGSGLELLVEIRHLQGCKIKQQQGQQERQRVIQDNDNHDVGELWFDGQPSTTVEDCVVVGIQEVNKCLVLFVSKTYQNHYRRIAAGEIKARYLTEDCSKGTIV
jgi:hypothetical protein